jgi:hypothetical protein
MTRHARGQRRLAEARTRGAGQPRFYTVTSRSRSAKPVACTCRAPTPDASVRPDRLLLPRRSKKRRPHPLRRSRARFPVTAHAAQPGDLVQVDIGGRMTKIKVEQAVTEGLSLIRKGRDGVCCPCHKSDGDAGVVIEGYEVMAERKGFEPSIRVYPV